jgi:dephospho-CoA kinase
LQIDEEAFQQMQRYLHRGEVTEEQARQVVLEYLGTDKDPLSEIAQDIYKNSP